MRGFIMSAILNIPDKLACALMACYGYYGDMPERKKKIEAEGFKYTEIQKIINQLYPIIKGIK